MVFREPPADFRPIEVVACLLESQGKFLFLKRHPLKPEGGRWCMPGGKVAAGESLEAALAREVEEETGKKMDAGQLARAYTVYVRYPDLDFTFHKFQAQLAEPFSPVLRPDEHTEHAWLTIEEGLRLNLVQDEAECLNIFLNIDQGRSKENIL